ncbi:MAG: AAA family ATPase [Actinomycetota bacterium]
MILQLRLRNWRAYESLDLELGPGTTFIVAANGTGKTSLILAAAWGIFGDAAGVDGAQEIRGEADSASVEVVIRLPAAGSATIRRTVNRKGKSQLEAVIGERTTTDQAELRTLIAQELGGDMRTVSRLTFLAHGGALETSVGEFRLREHLAEVFGVTPLLEAAVAADRLVTEAMSAARKIKVGQKTDRAEQDSLLAALGWVEEGLAAANATRREALAELEASDVLRQEAQAWEAHHLAVAGQREALNELAGRAAALLLHDAPPGGVPAGAQERPLAGPPGEARGGVPAGTLTTDLEAAEREVLKNLSAAERELAGTQARMRLLEEAAKALKDATGACPTCLRPLSAHDCKAALQAHAGQLDDLEVLVKTAGSREHDARLHLESVRTLLTEVRSLALPAPPAGPQVAAEAVPAVLERCRQALSSVQEIDRTVAELSAGKRLSVAKIAQIEQEEQQTTEIAALIRQEGISRAAADAFRTTADAISRERIEPLVAEVGRRWKTVFGADGLRLSPLGEITRQVGSRVLPFNSLSGGEKVWALLLTRLLITGASTRAPFVWLDEPLEHLDPRLRRVVAGTLARASNSGGLRQVVVTTYESELARQLMEDVPSASLIYVRGAGS